MKISKGITAAIILIAILAACGDDGPVAPIIQEVPTLQDPIAIAGSWEAIFRTDNMSTGVISMTLVQESAVAIGKWTEPVNGLEGSVQVTISEGVLVIAFMTLEGCDDGPASFRGSASGISNVAQLMAWDSDGWTCTGIAPKGVRLSWNRTS